MTSATSTSMQDEGTAVVTAARDGDEAAFTTLVERYRRELHVHCYRMLASFDDAEDLVQETFLRAWRSRQSFEGRSTFRAWLYRIATNACLDFLARNQRVVSQADVEQNGLRPPPHIPWLQPYPDTLLESVVTDEREPDSLLVAKENIQLAFLVAIQLLPAKQRAVLILRDVLEWSAKETAELLNASVASVNAALQRARTTMEKHQPRAPEWAAHLDPNTEERVLLERYVTATEAGDADALAALLRDDLRFAMPPEPRTYVGRDETVSGWVEGGFGSETFGEFRCLVTRVNRMPAVACYVRRPGDEAFSPLAIDVLRIQEGKIAEITAFSLDRLTQALGIPPALT